MSDQPTTGWECVLDPDAHAALKADPETPETIRFALDLCSAVDGTPGGVIFTVDPEIDRWLSEHPGFVHFAGGAGPELPAEEETA